MKEAMERLLAVARAPREELRRVTAAGKKAVGVLPYFCPEELVYAAGLLPFGLWGEALRCAESKRYFPAFICSMLHTTLELGIRGELNGLSAVMVPISCDSLKGMGANWEAAVPQIPVLNVAYAQNRRLEAGTVFTESQFKKLRGQLEAIAGAPVADGALREAIRVFNEDRRAVLAFSEAAAKRPGLVTPSQRSAAIKAGLYMDRAEHAALLRRVTAALEAAPAETAQRGVVLTGIMAEPAAVTELLGETGFTVLADQLAQESVPCRTLTDEEKEPLRALAERYGAIEGCSILYDPTKRRGHELVELAQKTGAKGVVWLMSKFCDPEEYDYVPVKKMLDEAGIPLLALDVDQQMQSFEKARSALEAFAEMI